MFVRLKRQGQLGSVPVVLSDASEEVINFYTILRDDPARLIAKISKIVFDEKEFYKLRQMPSSGLSTVERAVRFYYLVMGAHSGTYRANSNGGLNAPFAGGSGKIPGKQGKPGHHLARVR